MTFWHTVLAILLGNAVYDLAHMLLLNADKDGDDFDDDCHA